MNELLNNQSIVISIMTFCHKLYEFFERRQLLKSSSYIEQNNYGRQKGPQMVILKGFHLVRNYTKPLLPSIKTKGMQNTTTKSNIIVKQLKNRNGLFMKTDKGCVLVKMDKTDSKCNILETIEDMSLTLIMKNPLPLSLIKNCKLILKSINDIFGSSVKWKLMVPNPAVPKLYGPTKTHQSKLKM